MNEIKKLIDIYLTNKDVYTVEKVLDDIVKRTNSGNYMDIVYYMDDHKNATHELDLTIYISEIASIRYPQLEKIIKEKLENYNDPHVLEDLKSSLKKLEL